MSLQNFVDRVGPVLSADWLNQVDVDLNARLTSKQVGMSSSKSASYNRGALQDAVNSGLGRLDIVTDYAGETFLIDGAIDVPNGMEIQGINRWGCNISSTDLDAPIFRFGGSNTKNALRGLHLSYSGTPLAGANAIESNGSLDLDLYRMTVSSCWNGLHLIGGGYHEIVGLRVFSYENCGLLVDGAIDVNLSVFRMSAYARPGALGGIRLIGGVEAFTASQGDITLGTYGMTADTNGGGTRGNSPFYNRFSKVFFDSSLYNPAYLRYAQHIDFESCWFASAGHDAADTGYIALTDHAGIDMENCQHIRFIGGDTYGNGGNGVNHYGANKHITYHGMGFKRNGRWRSAARAGINVLAGATDFSVHGCTFEEDADTAEYRQSIAVNVNVGASDRYAITGNTLGGCSIVDGGTGTDREVSGNPGNGSLMKAVSLTEPRFGYVSGAADNTTAVQAAIVAAYNGILEMPNETVYASSLAIDDNIHLRWPEPANGILKQKAGSNTNFLVVNYTVVVNPIIENGTIDGNRSNNSSGNGIHLTDHIEPAATVTYGFGITLINSYVQNCADRCLYVGTNRNKGVLIASELKRGDTLLYITGSSDWRCSDSNFGFPLDGIGVEVASGADNIFTACSAYGALAYPMVKFGTTSSSPSKWIGGTINSNQREGLLIQGQSGIARSVGHMVIGCWFAENGLETDNTYSHIRCTDTGGAAFIGNNFRYASGNKPKYLLETTGVAGYHQWVGNTWDQTTAPYGTAISNNTAYLRARLESLVVEGTSYLGALTEDLTANSLRVVQGISGGSYLQAQGRAAGTAARLTVQSGGTNEGLDVSTKGTGTFTLWSGGLVRRLARFLSVASSVNWIDFYPAISGGSPQIAATGETDVDLQISPAGSGHVKFGNRTGSADAPVTGYVEIKDNAGNVRKLAVID